MKLLKDILFGCSIQALQGNTNLAIVSVTSDSRKIQKGSAFFALSGTVADGHQFIGAATTAGATAVICEVLPQELRDDITYVQVASSARALGICASNFYDNPSHRLKVIAITGTNGKTTVASTLHALFTQLDCKAGLLSTIVNKIHKTDVPATHTTPDAVAAQKLLREMEKQGCKYVFMEASSHGIAQDRIAGIKLSGAVFTNISHDHLDYHKTFDNYIKAKKRLFDDLPSTAFALVNADDRHGNTMLQNCKAKKLTYSLRTEAHYKCRVLEHQFNGQLLKINDTEVWTKMLGRFNAYNLTAVFGVANELRKERLQVMTAISLLNPVAGRFQYIQNLNKVTAIVDYAHTPDALANVLETIAQIRTRNERVITVVGCGGDRDKTKRPEMARIATRHSDLTILTSDNPRTEDPKVILEEMVAGVEMHLKSKHLVITDRREAIRAAVAMAQPGDILLVAGKGHETYQEIQGVKYPFDDMEELKQQLIPKNQ